MIFAALLIWLLLNILLFLFVVHEFGLMLTAIFKRKKELVHTPLERYPFVAIQLPVYNEKFVIRRLLEHVDQIQYPPEKLEIQILDDSTDETSEIIQEFLLGRIEKNHSFVHIRREKRAGYKAGALAYGMTQTTADFFAVFDADFLPDPSFLEETLPHFQDEKVGVVQTRWGHINEDFSLLTQAQSIMLDAHFGIEQRGRSRAGGFINFNGTAGIWRRQCIVDAGGWQADTLTEDLDLSFRAQAMDWTISYRFQFISPAELPLTFSAFRNQQYRWSKGAAECFRKNIALLWRSSARLKTKLMGSFHLLNSSVYLLVLGLMIMAPIIHFLDQNMLIEYGFFTEKVAPILGVCINMLLFIIFFAGRMICSAKKGKAALTFLPSLFVFFSMSIGISVHMVLGILEGYRGKKSEFVRTPKFGKETATVTGKKNFYGFRPEFNLQLIEFILFSYGVYWFWLGCVHTNVLMIIYSGILVLGFSFSLFFPNRLFSWKRM